MLREQTSIGMQLAAAVGSWQLVARVAESTRRQQLRGSLCRLGTAASALPPTQRCRRWPTTGRRRASQLCRWRSERTAAPLICGKLVVMPAACCRSTMQHACIKLASLLARTICHVTCGCRCWNHC